MPMIQVNICEIFKILSGATKHRISYVLIAVGTVWTFAMSQYIK